MAERVGFEPTVGFPLHSLSRRALSTAQTPLRGFRNRNRRFVCTAMYPFACDIPARILCLPLRLKFLCRGAACLPSRSEERLQDGGAFFRQNACCHLHPMIESR